MHMNHAQVLELGQLVGALRTLAEECGATHVVWNRRYEPAVIARDRILSARGLDDVMAIDLSDFYCTESVCPMAIGGVLVYRDAGHVNDEYTRTLAPYIEPRLQRLAPELFTGG